MPIKKNPVILYIPAIHKGYLDLLDNYATKIYVLGLDIIRKAPRLERDIRALDSTIVSTMLRSRYRDLEVIDLTLDNLSTELHEKDYILPEDDISREFTNNYLIDKNVLFIPTFLRWNRQITTSESEISPERKTTTEAFHKNIIKNAGKLAEKSPDWWRQVAAVIIKEGKVIASAYNRPVSSEHYTFEIFGDPRSNFDAGEHFELSKAQHAEAGAIALCAKKGISTENAEIYVTTFPCPVCAKLLSETGIKRVYYEKGYSLVDAEDILKSKNIEIIQVI